MYQDHDLVWKHTVTGKLSFMLNIVNKEHFYARLPPG
jgi:hypothetical protein